MFTDIPPEMLSLWPKLKGALRLMRRVPNRVGVIFQSGDEQALEACRRLAESTQWHCEELPEIKVTQREFDRRVYEPVMKPVAQRNLFAKSPPRICVIIPSVDGYGEWLHIRLKAMFERSKRTFLVFATMRDEHRLPSYLGGHYVACRKKGPALGSRHKRRKRPKKV